MQRSMMESEETKGLNLIVDGWSNSLVLIGSEDEMKRIDALVEVHDAKTSPLLSDDLSLIDATDQNAPVEALVSGRVPVSHPNTDHETIEVLPLGDKLEIRFSYRDTWPLDAEMKFPRKETRTLNYEILEGGKVIQESTWLSSLPRAYEKLIRDGGLRVFHSEDREFLAVAGKKDWLVLGDTRSKEFRSKDWIVSADHDAHWSDKTFPSFEIASGEILDKWKQAFADIKTANPDMTFEWDND